jgi:hypothetical protein
VSLLGWLAVFGAALRVDPWIRRHLGGAALLAVLCGAYGYGAGLEANALLDGTTPRLYPVTVRAMHVNRGRGATYYLGVSGWGPHPSGEDVAVSMRRYAATSIGDVVCVKLRPGALGVGWYVLGSCDNGPDPSASAPIRVE